jgi:hypothetical protein
MTVENKVEKGKRIAGRKASAERYIPFYEFLLFDPKYREMKDKAKILYSFLRKKTMDNEKKFESYEEAIANGKDPAGKGTESYLDENGDIFCIADNSELSIILQCHPNRVKDQKDELKKYGLLDEIPQFRKASRLYVLEPKTLTERWTYIEEMIELRKDTEQENLKKYKKHKEKVKEEKAKKTADENPSSEVDSSNSQNVSYYNSQNVSYYNSQNVSKYQSKGFKSNLKDFKSTFNLSISEDIKNSALPIPLKKLLDKKIDRLIKFEINISDIDLHYNAVKEVYPENEYAFVLDNLIAKMTFKPNNFASVMDDWLKRNKENLIKMIQHAKEKNKPIPKEMLPSWFTELNTSEQQRYWDEEIKTLFRQKQKEDRNKKMTDEEKETKQQEIEEMLKKLGEVK